MSLEYSYLFSLGQFKILQEKPDFNKKSLVIQTPLYPSIKEQCQRHCKNQIYIPKAFYWQDF